MDCQDEVVQIEQAVGKLPGVQEVKALLAASKAVVTYNAERVTPEQIKAAIVSTGCGVTDASVAAVVAPEAAKRDVSQVIGWGALGIVAVVVLVAALGERLGVFDAVV